MYADFTINKVDLFQPVVPLEKQHKNFRFISQPGLCFPEIEVLKNWADGFVDRDGKFIKEFQSTFNSSFWELYLFACFKELGFSIDLSYASPDFVVDSPHGKFIAEATIANNPKDFRPEWDKDIKMLDETNMDDIVRLSTIRLLQAITNKHKKFVSSYSKLTHVQNKPFVICVSPFDQPFFYLQDCMAIMRVLYAYEKPLVIPGRDNRETIIVGESQCHRVQKKPGVNIPLGLFTNSDMADVSAIFFNNRATMCKIRALAKNGNYSVMFSGSRAIETEIETGVERFVSERPDYQETLLDGFHVLLNPFAKNPLNIEVFKNREIAIHNYNPEIDSYQLKIPNGFLYQRTCMTFIPQTEEAIKQYKSSTSGINNYQELTSETWSEDELNYFGGQNGPFCENHMAHYRGWTILVSLDSIDEDWSSIAVNTLVYNHPQFMEAYGNDSIPATMLSEWLSTKEEAYAAIKLKIECFSEQEV